MEDEEMLKNDSNGTDVVTLSKSVFPRGTKAKIVTCAFIGRTSARAYCIQTEDDIKGLAEGKKSAWYLERDLKNP
jgi:hypothetical protein